MSGTNDRDEIKNFLNEQFDAVEEGGELAAVVMYHHAGTGEIELHSMKTGHTKWKNAEAMAYTFDAIAVRHARGISGGGGQQFDLRVTRGTEGRPSAILPFIRVGAPNLGAGSMGGLSTEPPTPTGLTQQAQRWGEQITQQTFAQIAHLQVSQQKALDARDTKIEAMEKINGELWIACKGLLLELDKRRHAEKLAELSAARMAEFQKQVMMLAPALLNMMAGREVFPLNAADTATIDTIAAMASGEDLRMLTSVLSQKEGGAAIAATLTDRFDQYHKRKAAEAATEKRLLNELPDRTYDEAERDAAGEAIHALRSNGAGNGAPQGPTPKALQQRAHIEPAAQANGGSQPMTDDLLDIILATVNEGEVEMLATMLAAKRPDQPDLAQRIRERFEASRKL
jgi:hypothetical protein